MLGVPRLSESLDEDIPIISTIVDLYKELYLDPIQSGARNIVLPTREAKVVTTLREHLNARTPFSALPPEYGERISDLYLVLHGIAKDVALYPERKDGSRDINLDVPLPFHFFGVQHPYFVWHLEDFLGDEVEEGRSFLDRRSREIGPVYTDSFCFGMRLIYDHHKIWTDEADVALIVDSGYNPWEGFMGHQWVWFKDGETVDPKHTRLRNVPAYDDLPHALKEMSSVIGVPEGLLEYVIAHSNLSAEHKRSIGFEGGLENHSYPLSSNPKI